MIDRIYRKWYNNCRWLKCERAGTGRQARLRGVCLWRTGSSPVSRTTKETSFVYQDKRGFFHAFRGKIALNIGKYCWNRGWNGHWGRASPCFLLLGSEIGVLLFVFLCAAKKLAKQHPTGFEFGKAQRCRRKVTAKHCKSTGFVL